MLSLQLWRSLANPPRQHPLFQYVLSYANKEESRVTAGFFMWAFMCSGFTFIWTIIFEWLLYFVLGLFILVNTIYALRWVMRIARSLVEEKEAGRYDLLAALPLGLLGTSWAISTGCVHRRSSFRLMPHLILMSAFIIVLMLCGMSGITLILLDNISTNEQAFLANLNVAELAIIGIPFVIVFYIDHLYSVLTAVLFGQWITIDLKSPEEAQVRSFLGFMALQVSIYAFCYGVAALAIPSLLTALGFTGIPVLLGMSLFGVIFFVFVREMLIRFLWSRLIRAYAADEDEIVLVLKPFYQVDAILKASQAARLKAAAGSSNN